MLSSSVSVAVSKGAAGHDGHGDGSEDGVHFSGWWKWSGCLDAVVMDDVCVDGDKE